jgi:hypothetical protein
MAAGMLFAASWDMRQSLLAIRARIKGEFDHPALVAHGGLHTDKVVDILDIVESVLEKTGVADL